MTNFISKMNSPVGIAELVGENDEDGSLDEVGANETEGCADSIDTSITKGQQMSYKI